MNNPPPDDLALRILDLLDGTLDAGELARLDADLRASAEARELYRQLATLHSTLEEQETARSEIGFTPLIPVARLLDHQRRRMVRLSLISAAAVLLISALALWFKLAPGTPSALAGFQVTQDSIFTLTHAPDVEQSPSGRVLDVGSRLRMSSGTMEAVFDSGVRCVIEAPCDISVTAEDRISVASGIAWFEVPPAAVGFTVDSGELTIVDLGTEFGLVNRADVGREVHVIRGSVEAIATQSGQRLVLRAGEARRMDARSGFEKIEPAPGRFTTALPETIAIVNPSFEMDENPSATGEFEEGERGDFGSELTGWISQSGSPREVHVGWRGVPAEELHPYPPADGRDSQVLSLIAGGSVLNVTGRPWSSLRAGDTLTLTISLGLRAGKPALVWNEGTFFGLTDGDFSPSDVPTPADTVIHSGVIAANPATGNQSGDGTLADVSLKYTVLPADLKRPGQVGILLVADSKQRENAIHQSFFDHVRLRVGKPKGERVEEP